MTRQVIEPAPSVGSFSLRRIKIAAVLIAAAAIATTSWLAGHRTGSGSAVADVNECLVKAVPPPPPVPVVVDKNVDSPPPPTSVPVVVDKNVDTPPPTPTAGVTELVERAHKSVLRGQWAKALSLCESALAVDKSHRKAINVCAVVSCKLKNVAKAKAYIGALTGGERMMARAICMRSGVKLEPI